MQLTVDRDVNKYRWTQYLIYTILYLGGDFMNIATRLKDLRKQKGYSQEKLADLLNVSRQAVSKWEGDQGYPDLDNIIRISNLYGVSTDYILTGAEQNFSREPNNFFNGISGIMQAISSNFKVASPGANQKPPFDMDGITKFTVNGNAIHRKISGELTDMSIHVNLGSISLDLRNAILVGDIQIDCSGECGAVDIRIPSTAIVKLVESGSMNSIDINPAVSSLDNSKYAINFINKSNLTAISIR